MTLNARREDCKVIIGKWTANSEGLETFTKLEMAQMWGGTLYSFIGFELHAVQQGQSELSYKGRRVWAKRMDDTSGIPVTDIAEIELGDGEGSDTFTVGELDEDELINWEGIE